MTDKERDPKAVGAEGATDDTQAAADAAADMDETDDLGEFLEDDEADDEAAEAAVETVPGAVAAGGRSRERRPKGGGPLVAPSISEQAVHINDRASAVFVIAMIGVFVAIFGYALLFGQGGLVSNMRPSPTPAPVITPAPTASPTSAPSASGSAVPSASASAVPSASSSAVPSVAPSASPVASPSAAASPGPSAS